MKVFAFNREKFRELVLLIAHLSADDPTFGAVKLNKVLFYADFEAYAELGSPITGARYQHLEFGPAARPLLPIQDELIRFGEAAFESRHYHGRQQRRLVAKRRPNYRLFTEKELEFVERAIGRFEDMDASTLSGLSHDESKGWQITEDGEDIPYESVFLSTEPPPAEAIELGQRLAAERDWKSK